MEVGRKVDLSAGVNVAAKVAKVVVFIFGLPFVLIGLGVFIGGVTVLIRQQDLVGGIFMTIFGLVFAGGGIAFMTFAGRAPSMMRRFLQARASSPQQPWMWNHEWAAGKIRSTSVRGLGGIWFFALFWNAISWTVVTVFVMQGDFEWPMLFIGIFPLVGIFVLIAAIRMTLQRRKFGIGEFMMSRVPGEVGGTLSGNIRTRFSDLPTEGVKLKLACVRRVRSGKNTVDRPVWSEERTAIPHRSGISQEEAIVPVQFEIPATSAPTSIGWGGDRIVWKLEASADVPGVDYSDKFEVPVFKLDEAGAAPPSEQDEKVNELLEKLQARVGSDS